MTDLDNLFRIPVTPSPQEKLDQLAAGAGIRIERIVSTGQSTPEGEWYDQEQDEWVALLQGEAVLAYEDGEKVQMVAGDHLLIPAHVRHRVESTTSDPACIWVAVHANLSANDR